MASRRDQTEKRTGSIHRRSHLVASLLNEDLIDELRLIVHPVVLGKGQALFGGVKKRLSLDLVQAKSTQTGRVIVTYRTRGEEQ